MRLLIKIFIPTFLFLIFSCTDDNLLGPVVEQEIIEINEKSISESYFYGSWEGNKMIYIINDPITSNKSIKSCIWNTDKTICEVDGVPLKPKYERTTMKFNFFLNHDGSNIFEISGYTDGRLEFTERGNWLVEDNKFKFLETDPFSSNEEIDYSFNDGILELIFNRNNETMKLYLNKLNETNLSEYDDWECGNVHNSYIKV